MEQYLRAPPVIPTGVDISDSNPPRESDHDTEILSPSATEAFQRLIAAIDNPPPTPLDIDDQLYSALAGLSSSHPWSTLVRDLKGVLPELDRHFHTHLLSGMLQAQLVPSNIQLLNPEHDHLGTFQSRHEQREKWTISMGGLRHMPAHLLKALLFSEWCMPAARACRRSSSTS